MVKYKSEKNFEISYKIVQVTLNNNSAGIWYFVQEDKLFLQLNQYEIEIYTRRFQFVCKYLEQEKVVQTIDVYDPLL